MHIGMKINHPDYGPGALTRDAIAQFLHPQPEWRLTLFSLAGHPHLQHVQVTAPDVTQYAALLGGGQ